MAVLKVLLQAEESKATAQFHKRYVSFQGIDDDLTQSSSVELERQADALLAKELRNSRDSGIYSTAQLDRKMRNEQRHIPKIEEYGVPDEIVQYLVETQVNDLIDAANLSAMQEIVYRLYVSGYSIKRIALDLNRTSRTIHRRLMIIKKKVMAAYKEGKFAGWYEVYLSEVNRTAHHG